MRKHCGNLATKSLRNSNQFANIFANLRILLASWLSIEMFLAIISHWSQWQWVFASPLTYTLYTT